MIFPHQSFMYILLQFGLFRCGESLNLLCSNLFPHTLSWWPDLILHQSSERLVACQGSSLWWWWAAGLVARETPFRSVFSLMFAAAFTGIRLVSSVSSLSKLKHSWNRHYYWTTRHMMDHCIMHSSRTRRSILIFKHIIKYTTTHPT